MFKTALYPITCALTFTFGLATNGFSAESPDTERLAAAPTGNTISSQPAGSKTPDASSEPTDIENPPAIGCQVDSIVFASKVEAKMPEGVATTFAPGLVYCWSRIRCQTAPGTLKHVWTQGKTQREISLRMGSASGRVWSQKQVTPGTWKVDVMTSDGELAGSATIEVK